MSCVRIRPRLAVSVLAFSIAAAAACTGSKKSSGNPAVHDDVYVTGAANNRLVLSGDTAFVVNSTDNTVDTVDLTTCTEAQHSCQRTHQTQLSANSNPYDMILDGGKLWVTDLGTNDIVAIDPATGLVTATVSTGAGFAFNGPQSFAAKNGTLLVSNNDGFGFGPGFVSFVQGTAIVAQVATTQQIPVGFAAWPDGNVALVNNGTADFSTGVGVATSVGGIDVIDATTHAIVRNIDLGLTLPGPIAVVATDGQYAYTASGSDAHVLKIDILAGTSQSFAVAASASFLTDLVLDGGILYVLSFSDDTIYALDPATLAPVTVSTWGASSVKVGPGGATPKGPNWATVWSHGGTKHLLVLLTLSNSMTDVIIP
jgi:YVTN family beta-propeller protein